MCRVSAANCVTRLTWRYCMSYSSSATEHCSPRALQPKVHTVRGLLWMNTTQNGWAYAVLTAAEAFAAYLYAGSSQTTASCPRAAQYVEHGTCNCSGPSVRMQDMQLLRPLCQNASTAFLGRCGSELWTYTAVVGFVWRRSNTQTTHFLQVPVLIHSI